ncbi:histidinol-phosphatase HisJ [Bacillus massilinigeriensis]|uniref:histidinol-phosphatase HisJ n=1 Tax=Bacillus massilionigeriensis TaxID=1805475 RepID=UPI00096AEEC8|nr:histidinol-phosphatase HisJ [Bacillus massilionigeriensis]
MFLKDGHIHTPYCPHGTKDSFNSYIEKAITLGFQEITFTEHAPLPHGFIDTTPEQDSAMQFDELDLYFAEVEQLKEEYASDIKINTGLEVDFIEGYENEITSFLQTIGSRLDDAILSVHFLKNGDQYHCLDYSPEYFSQMIVEYGSIEKVYKKYFNTLLLSINADLGPYKPKRIGHISLVKKFQLKYPIECDIEQDFIRVLKAVKAKGYELDYNGAGTAKPLCRETYPPKWVAKKAKELGISLIYGSDAHQVKELGQGLHSMV